MNGVGAAGGLPVLRELDIRNVAYLNHDRWMLAGFPVLADGHVGQHDEAAPTLADCVGGSYRWDRFLGNVESTADVNSGFETDDQSTALGRLIHFLRASD